MGPWKLRGPGSEEKLYPSLKNEMAASPTAGLYPRTAWARQAVRGMQWLQWFCPTLGVVVPYPGRTYICHCPTAILQTPGQIHTYVMVPSEYVCKIGTLCYTSGFRCRVVQTFERARLKSPRDPQSQKN